MGKIHSTLDDKLEQFIKAQRMFFVASAPSGSEGHVNCSPKGLDSLRVLGPTTVAYVDFVGSGAETIAHLRDNGRLVLMFCAFEGPPRILRVHGRGTYVEPKDAEFTSLRSFFDVAKELHVRGFVQLEVTRIADSCGYGVPLFSYEGERTQLGGWGNQRSSKDVRAYQRDKNAASIDGLPALRWAAAARES